MTAGSAGEPAGVVWESPDGGRIEGKGPPLSFHAARSGGAVWVWIAGRTYRLREAAAAGVPAAEAGAASRGEADTAPRAPIPGTVARVAVRAGDRVEPGSLLVTISAMKMEHEIRAAVAGRVAQVQVAEGGRVEAGDPLVRIDAG